VPPICSLNVEISLEKDKQAYKKIILLGKEISAPQFQVVLGNLNS
jgi:hypothetical protein